jgi:acyl-[acyl-carrier-protein]-phospholipid O-acyltransferase/long-chain-fatty-acid--[acyl-carrier-protein] ligase
MNPRGYTSLLRNSGFRFLLTTQFLGALNDNMLRIIASLYILSPASGTTDPATWIVIGGIAFIVPCLLFAGPAGRLSDALPKRKVLVGTKVAELLVVVGAFVGFLAESLSLTIAVLFLMATQSAFFSPARYSILPELFPRSDLPHANGLGEMSIFAAVIIGMCGGAAIFDIADGDALIIVGPMILIASAGIVASLFVPGRPRVQTKAAAPSCIERPGSHSRNHNLLVLQRNRALIAAVAGISAFWCVGSILQINILFFGNQLLDLSDTGIGLLQGTLGLGVGAGGLLAGRLVHHYPMMRLMQAGTFTLGIALFALVLVASGPLFSFVAMFFAGAGGGIFMIPIIAFMQAKCEPSRCGRLFAINNFMNMAGALLGISLFWLLHSIAGLSPDLVMLILAIVTTATLLVISLASLRRVTCTRHRPNPCSAFMTGGTR